MSRASEWMSRQKQTHAKVQIKEWWTNYKTITKDYIDKKE